MRNTFFSTLICIATFSGTTSAAEFLLKDGERVLFLGNTMVEREQEYGDWELQLTLAAGEKKLTFRNLGWSGDTVWAESRGLFDPPAVGYQRTLELVRELKPTTILIGYGAVESQRGPAGLNEFKKQYEKLRQDLLANNVKFVHLSPVLLEAATFPELAEGVEEHVAAANKNLSLYAEAIREICAKNGELFIDLQATQRSSDKKVHWTENGVQLSGYGYKATAAVIASAFGGEVSQSEHNQMRELIQRKNELFFHRWRPQNFTYLLGFRKHEQGQNAVEIAECDPLIEELESQIQEVKSK